MNKLLLLHLNHIPPYLKVELKFDSFKEKYYNNLNFQNQYKLINNNTNYFLSIFFHYYMLNINFYKVQSKLNNYNDIL